jgi:hypothetical protein
MKFVFINPARSIDYSMKILKAFMDIAAIYFNKGRNSL